MLVGGEKQTVETDVPADSDMHCPKMAVTLGFGWSLVLIQLSFSWAPLPPSHHVLTN